MVTIRRVLLDFGTSVWGPFQSISDVTDVTIVLGRVCLLFPQLTRALEIVRQRFVTILGIGSNSTDYECHHHSYLALFYGWLASAIGLPEDQR